MGQAPPEIRVSHHAFCRCRRRYVDLAEQVLKGNGCIVGKLHLNDTQSFPAAEMGILRHRDDIDRFPRDGKRHMAKASRRGHPRGDLYCAGFAFDRLDSPYKCLTGLYI